MLTGGATLLLKQTRRHPVVLAAWYSQGAVQLYRKNQLSREQPPPRSICSFTGTPAKFLHGYLPKRRFRSLPSIRRRETRRRLVSLVKQIQ